ncbi:methyl-accepting chemotaxis protein [Burkholderia gladioli]
MKIRIRSVRGKLVLSFGMMLLGMVALAIIAVVQVQNIRERLDDIIDLNGVKERYAINFRGSVHDRSIALRDVILVGPDELPTVVEHIRKLQRDYEESARPFETVFLPSDNVSPEEKSIYQGIRRAQAQAMPLIDQVIELQTQGQSDAARKVLLDGARPALVAWLAAINTMIDFEESLSANEGLEAREISREFKIVMAAITALACALGLGIAWLVTRNIAATLGADPREMIEFAEAIRGGNLSVPSPARGEDEASVMAAVTKMRDSLAEIVARVREAADGVVQASREIAHGTNDLSARTSKQAVALEQATHALGEFDASVSENASNASHADQLANQASSKAGNGGDAVGRVVNTMRDIDSSSHRIGEIIGVIDAIAFQTNILALNAAVEAAKAGGHGRGFAVVAGEVRILAQKSAAAAKEIKSLVRDSNARVSDGGRLVEVAGSTIAEVIQSSRNVTSIMSEINDTCRLQTHRIGEVRGMIEQLEDSTQQNAALVEQSSTATEMLVSQAERLLETVSVFRTAMDAALAPMGELAGMPARGFGARSREPSSQVRRGGKPARFARRWRAAWRSRLPFRASRLSREMRRNRCRHAGLSCLPGGRSWLMAQCASPPACRPEDRLMSEGWRIGYREARGARCGDRLDEPDRYCIKSGASANLTRRRRLHYGSSDFRSRLDCPP